MCCTYSWVSVLFFCVLTRNTFRNSIQYVYKLYIGSFVIFCSCSTTRCSVLYVQPSSAVGEVVSQQSTILTTATHVVCWTEPVSVVCDLGAMIDAELTMQEHVNRTAQTCFYHLRRLRSVRQQLGCDVTAQLVSALVLSRLDYCNAVLADFQLLHSLRFWKVLHAAARLDLGLRPRDHVTSALNELHWLPITQRIKYNLCLLVHKASIGQAPNYIIDLLTANADVPSKSSLRSSDSGNYVPSRTRTKLEDRAFSVAASRAWNCLPTELKLTRSTPAFRRNFNTFLFKVTYG